MFRRIMAISVLVLTLALPGVAQANDPCLPTAGLFNPEIVGMREC